MRVVVVGHNGLLGSTLVPCLEDSGHEVLGIARRGDAAKNADATQADELCVALDVLRPDVIVNLAALTNVDECERYPQQAYLANVRVVEILAHWLQRTGGDRHLVQVSTDHVYDGPRLHRESDVTLTNYYAFSKFAGELAAVSVPSTVLRTSFFGPSRHPERRSFSDWLVDSLTTAKPVTVFTDVYFSPLSMQTLVRLITRVIARPVQGIFNLGSREGLSKAEFAYRFASVLGLPEATMTLGSIAESGLTAYRPRNMCMDSTKFEQTFGVALPTLEQEIQSLRSAYAK